jgi:formylglycine-generating enzyme required for sulfatase activity
MANLTFQVETKQARYFTESLGEDQGLDMVQIPGGEFDMGSADDDENGYSDERPQHRVSVPSFFMGRYPVTQAQWRAVAAMPQIKQPLEPDPARFKGDRHPVESVSWYDAVEFCDRLSAHTGRTYRLPTEAEWEYACRAHTTTPYAFGPKLTADLANFAGADEADEGEKREGTTPIDCFDYANGFGLWDMHGNVFEWCLDHWHGNYEGAPEDGSAWFTDSEDASRVIRGGSWSDRPWICRSAYRFYDGPRESDINIGFRVICVSPRALG